MYGPKGDWRRARNRSKSYKPALQSVSPAVIQMLRVHKREDSSRIVHRILALQMENFPIVAPLSKCSKERQID